jgi:putative membrane fusion protein
LLSILGIFAYFYFYHPTAYKAGYDYVVRGEIVLRDQGDALVIRREQIYELPKHGKAEFSVIEGEMLKQGEPLATLFTPGYDEQLTYELQEVQERIFAYQRENIVNYILDSDVLGLQSAINETILDIQTYIRDGRQHYLEGKERDLRRLLAQRQEILDKTVVPDMYLRELYEQEAEIKRQLGNSMIEVKAPASGFVSFSSDGLEDILDFEAVANITIDDIYTFIRQKRTLVVRQTENRIPFIRLIDPNKWYLACVIAESDVFYKAGDEIELRFIEDYEKTFNGRVHKVSRGSKASLIVIELNDDIQAVVNKRVTTAEIGRKLNGLMIPIRALIKQDGVFGLRVVHGSSFVFAPVEVLAFGDKYAIIEDVEDAYEVDINTRVMSK